MSGQTCGAFPALLTGPQESPGCIQVTLGASPSAKSILSKFTVVGLAPHEMSTRSLIDHDVISALEEQVHRRDDRRVNET